MEAIKDVIAIVAPVLTLLGIYLSHRATREKFLVDSAKRDQSIEDALRRMETTICNLSDRLNEKLESLSSRLDGFTRDIDRLEQDVSGLKSDVAAIKGTLAVIDRFVSREKG